MLLAQILGLEAHISFWTSVVVQRVRVGRCAHFGTAFTTLVFSGVCRSVTVGAVVVLDRVGVSVPGIRLNHVNVQSAGDALACFGWWGQCTSSGR